ncbi:hypothetical protein BDD12DRAFT_227400 [Trichophaea hybrida]|nr:hypothetical protein BDD12DRAFT_227400 [Trichophaea hybrida]
MGCKYSSVQVFLPLPPSSPPYSPPSTSSSSSPGFYLVSTPSSSVRHSLHPHRSHTFTPSRHHVIHPLRQSKFSGMLFPPLPPSITRCHGFGFTSILPPSLHTITPRGQASTVVCPTPAPAAGESGKQ